MKFTLENQGEFPDNFLPTLDFKLQWDPAIAKIIRYKFFKISISTKLLILTLTSMGGPERPHQVNIAYIQENYYKILLDLPDFPTLILPMQ